MNKQQRKVLEVIRRVGTGIEFQEHADNLRADELQDPGLVWYTSDGGNVCNRGWHPIETVRLRDRVMEERT